MRGLILAALFGLGGTAILVSLGVWQTQRLAWKEGVIAELETRLSAAPVPLPLAPTEAADEYLRVAADGRIGPEELHVLTSAKPWGPGFRVITPFETPDGRRVLVDRGYVPQTEKAAARQAETLALTGALLWPDETDSFTPEPDAAKNMWFARDVGKMAAALGTEPVLIVAETPGSEEWPKPQPLTVALPNDHLQYAITWFSLAAIWLTMTGALLLRQRRRAA